MLYILFGNGNGVFFLTFFKTTNLQSWDILQLTELDAWKGSNILGYVSNMSTKNI